jgi:hypothetical protein
VNRALAASAVLLLLLAGAACVDDNIPPRPSIVAPVTDGGAGSSGGADSSGGDDSSAGDDGGTCEGTDGGVVVLARASRCAGMKLVVFAGKLYWTEEDTGLVRSVPTSCGRPTTIAASQTFPRALAVDETSIYWVVGDDPDPSKTHDTIMKRDLTGGTPSVFVPAENDPNPLGGANAVNALLAANGWLYFARYIYTYKTPIDVAAPIPIGASPPDDLGQPGAFALGGAYLYQVELSHNAISRERVDGTQVGMLQDGSTANLAPDRIAVSELPNLVTDAVAVVDDHVAWARDSSIWRKAGNLLWTDPKVLVATSLGLQNRITGFVVSDYIVFFGAYNDSTVQTVGFYDGTPQVIATDQPAPSQFAADDQNVYWRTSDCRIMKLPKP